MDFGDLIVMAFILWGIFSSVGSSKKKQARKLLQNQQRPSTRVAGTAPSRGAGARPAPSGAGAPQMHDILRQLGLEMDGLAETKQAEEPTARHEASVPERELDAPVTPPRERVPTNSRTVSRKQETLGDHTAAHKQFHDKYVKPLEEGRVERHTSRARRLLTQPQSLRKAMLLQEIVGPPKSLQ